MVFPWKVSRETPLCDAFWIVLGFQALFVILGAAISLRYKNDLIWGTFSTAHLGYFLLIVNPVWKAWRTKSSRTISSLAHFMFLVLAAVSSLCLLMVSCFLKVPHAYGARCGIALVTITFCIFEEHRVKRKSRIDEKRNKSKMALPMSSIG